MDGILRCSRYAFGPNRLHYCGPDRNSQLYANIKEEAVDPDLTRILSQFETMYPYLVHIATANHIADPLDERVVEAYWIGNALLDRVSRQDFYLHLADRLGLQKRLGARLFSHVSAKVGDGALPHHSFHVFDIWRHSRDAKKEHDLSDIDECRISWGKVIRISGPSISVMVAPLAFREGKLILDTPLEKTFLRRLESDYDIEQLKAGDLVSIHWSVICEKITPKQAANLRKYTLRHIALANETL